MWYRRLVIVIARTVTTAAPGWTALLGTTEKFLTSIVTGRWDFLFFGFFTQTLTARAAGTRHRLGNDLLDHLVFHWRRRFVCFRWDGDISCFRLAKWNSFGSSLFFRRLGLDDDSLRRRLEVIHHFEVGGHGQRGQWRFDWIRSWSEPRWSQRRSWTRVGGYGWGWGYHQPIISRVSTCTRRWHFRRNEKRNVRLEKLATLLRFRFLKSQMCHIYTS